MPMSEDEQRSWRELEARLAGERRLVHLMTRLGAPGGGMPRRTSLLWAVGGGFGLALVGVGAGLHSFIMGVAGVVLLAATLVVVGVALIVVGLNS